MNPETYASRKRKKPQKSVRSVPAEADGKSNPSKRHRQRLNGELERLANLLPFPQDVVSKLDKLTVLRLSVSYLRAKSHFTAKQKSAIVQYTEGNGLTKHGVELIEGELLLQVLNGFVLVVTASGNIFYASSTIQDYLGFHQSDVIHQPVFEFIHVEDRAEFQRQLHWALKSPLSPDKDSKDLTTPQTHYIPEQLPPENSTFLERNFVCRLRCLLDNTSGFIVLNFQGRLKFLHGQNEKDKGGMPIPRQLALFALASPLQRPSILEIRTKNYFFKTKHKLDFTPTACDAKGQIMLGYTEEELCFRGSGYQFIHAADMLYCAENHLRMIKTGESGMTVFRLLTKLNGWMWVQANARLVYKNGRPEFIIVSHRVVTNEEGEENLNKRSLLVPFNHATGEAMLYDSCLPTAADVSGSDNSHQDKALDPDSILGSLMKQDKSIYSNVHSQNKHPLPSQASSLPPEEDYSGVFSSSWQESIVSFPESSLLKHELQHGSAGDRDSELWIFMKELGISFEDFELFQQDETFLNVDLDGRDTPSNVTDEILCYVQESLRKRPDCGFFDSVKLGEASPSCTPSVLQCCGSPALQECGHKLLKIQSLVSPQQVPTASQWLLQPAEQSTLHPQSLHLQPPVFTQPHCLQTQPHSQTVTQATLQQFHRLAQLSIPQQQQSPNEKVLPHKQCQHHQQGNNRLLFPQPLPVHHMQLCQKPVDMTCCDSLSQQGFRNNHHFPPLNHNDE